MLSSPGYRERTRRATAVLAVAEGDTKSALDLPRDRAQIYLSRAWSGRYIGTTCYGKDASGSLVAPDGTSYSASVVGSGPRELDVKPRNLSVVRSGSTAILTWTPGADAASQIVGAIIGVDTTSLKRATLGGTANDHAFTGLRVGRLYVHSGRIGRVRRLPFAERQLVLLTGLRTRSRRRQG